MSRITRQMLEKAPPKKKPKEPERERWCANCIHAIPYFKNYLRNRDKSPIMCSCKYQEHLMILNHDVCENHEFDIL